MVISLNEMTKARVTVQDGNLGKVEELYFDDQEWQVRFFAVGTTRFLGRDVLISPTAVLAVDTRERLLELDLTREQVKASPPLDLARPVTQQMAEQYFDYYGWPYFGGAAATWGLGTLRRESPPPPSAPHPRAGDDPHLRSFREVTGYSVQGTDEGVGELEDLMVDEESWAIRYLLVDTRSWWPSKKVLLLPGMVHSLDWHYRQVQVGLTREQIRQAPAWEPGRPLDRELERRLYQHYGLAPYWRDDVAEGTTAPI